MSYGLLINRKNLNLGDDIQSYAESMFLPKIDYLVDREYINDFKPKMEGEKVALIMGAWWSFRKWNFPPAESIVPLCISMHITNYSVSDGGTPVYDEFIQGVGGDYLRHFGPVGSRDMATLELLKKNDIPAFFSGCVTLTLPKQKKTKDRGNYILLVDVSEDIKKKIIKDLGDSDIEIRTASNIRKSRRSESEMDDWSFRRSEAIDLLTLYQNARSVVTSRLHVALPCLAMEVPVLCVFDPANSRFSPYNELLHMVSPEEYLKGGYHYDLINPIKNKNAYLKYRKSLTKQMSDFVEKTSTDINSIDTKVKYSSDVKEWRSKLMSDTLDKWVYDSQIIAGDLSRLRTRHSKLERELAKMKETNTLLDSKREDAERKYRDITNSRYYINYKRAGRVLRRLRLIK